MRERMEGGRQDGADGVGERERIEKELKRTCTHSCVEGRRKREKKKKQNAAHT